LVVEHEDDKGRQNEEGELDGFQTMIEEVLGSIVVMVRTWVQRLEQINARPVNQTASERWYVGASPSGGDCDKEWVENRRRVGAHQLVDCPASRQFRSQED